MLYRAVFFDYVDIKEKGCAEIGFEAILTRFGAHPVTHENVLSYDFRVSGSVSESGSWRIDLDCDTDSDTDILWYQFLFSKQWRGRNDERICWKDTESESHH
jgi:hypothetical protein